MRFSQKLGGFPQPEKCHTVWSKITKLSYPCTMLKNCFIKMIIIKNQPYHFCQNVQINPTIYRYCYLLQKLFQTRSLFRYSWDMLANNFLVKYFWIYCIRVIFVCEKLIVPINEAENQYLFYLSYLISDPV